MWPLRHCKSYKMKYLGRALFWLTWPLVYVYSPVRLRARVLVRYDDEFVVVNPHFGSGQWQLPGGGVRRGESLVQAARREVNEELGIDLLGLPIRLINPSSPAHWFVENGLFKRYALFVVDLKKRPAVTIPAQEISAYCWFKKDQRTGLASHVHYALDNADQAYLVK
jgi:8-oxo-dGTP pyrophosphatase MutT (NUDIX family)